MSNFELIDDYLANRLNEQDRKAFEQQLEGDPALKEEVEFQQQVVEGVRHARVVELKTMLNNVPVSGNSWSGGKVAAAVVSVGIVVTSLYLLLKEDQAPIASAEKPNQEITNAGDSSAAKPVLSAEEESKDEVSSEAKEQPAKENSKTENKDKTTTPVRKPEIEVVDPSDEFKEPEEKTDTGAPVRSEISTSKMEVITGSADKKHTFHYQFVQGKLMLFGPFDRSLYEILEIHGDGHAVFLFYKENYYLLDEKRSKITSLEPIRDGQLLKKLKEYRGR